MAHEVKRPGFKFQVYLFSVITTSDLPGEPSSWIRQHGTYFPSPNICTTPQWTCRGIQIEAVLFQRWQEGWIATVHISQTISPHTVAHLPAHCVTAESAQTDLILTRYWDVFQGQLNKTAFVQSMCRGEDFDQSLSTPRNQSTRTKLEPEHQNPFRSEGSTVQGGWVLKPLPYLTMTSQAPRPSSWNLPPLLPHSSDFACQQVSLNPVNLSLNPRSEDRFELCLLSSSWLILW